MTLFAKGGTKYTDEEVATRILEYCVTPRIRTAIVKELGGNKPQLIRVLEQLCIQAKINFKQIKPNIRTQRVTFYSTPKSLVDT